MPRVSENNTTSEGFKAQKTGCPGEEWDPLNVTRQWQEGLSWPSPTPQSKATQLAQAGLLTGRAGCSEEAAPPSPCSFPGHWSPPGRGVRHLHAGLHHTNMGSVRTCSGSCWHSGKITAHSHLTPPPVGRRQPVITAQRRLSHPQAAPSLTSFFLCSAGSGSFPSQGCQLLQLQNDFVF